MPVIQICTVSIERVFLRSCDCCHKGLKRAMDKDPSRGCDCSSASLGATNKKPSPARRLVSNQCLVSSRTDWLLRFLYRTSARQVRVAGLGPVAWNDRRMINVDLSSVIDGHLDYAKNMDTILAAIGVR